MQRDTALRRLLVPSSIAVVGVGDGSMYARTVEPTLSSDAQVYFVYPEVESVLGRPAFPSLTDVGRPVDAVVSFMSAARSTSLAEEAADLDVGGLVLVAGGFSEAGAEGVERQTRLTLAADRSGMAVVGPNGIGYKHVTRNISLSMEEPSPHRRGGLSIVSQSGAMLIGVASAARSYGRCGLNYLISSGNEPVTDLADYVAFLADDPATTAIGLILEKVRRPQAFFQAVSRAAEAGKPVVALKLARQARSQRIAASHTGALTGDAWIYDVAFEQAGVIMASDPDDLVDRMALFDQVPRDRWSRVEALGVLSVTGGYASLSVDLAVDEGLSMPDLTSMEPWLATKLPGVTVPNPLDVTGLGKAVWPDIVAKYAASDELDALVFTHPLDDEYAHKARPLLEAFSDAGVAVAKPVVVTNNCGSPAAWVADSLGQGVAMGRGLRPTLRGLHALGTFVRYRERAALAERLSVQPVEQPELNTYEADGHHLVCFDAAMSLVAQAGIPVAPYAVIPHDVDVAGTRPDFEGPYVVKLADVPHRTELGAVLFDVPVHDLPSAVTRLRDLAVGQSLRGDVCVQPVVEVTGEVLIGVQGGTELGPAVVLGLGGTLVEVLNRVGGRMAPFGRVEADSLIDEFRDLRLMHGYRGQPGWDLDALADMLVRASILASSSAGWLTSLDLNPIIYSKGSFAAVDALLEVR